MAGALRPAPATVGLADAYFDAVPRPDTDAVEVGPFTLFVSRTPWSYYARPALGHPGKITAADVARLDKACPRYGVALAIEWVDEVHPELAHAAARAGLEVRTHALMAAAPGEVPAEVALPAPGVTLRVVEAGEPALLDARAVANVAFEFGGCERGGPGPRQRDEAVARLGPELVAHLHARARAGLTVTAVAESPTEGALAAGSYQPIGAVAEIVGVGTLPVARRRGLAGAVTAFLASHAQHVGVRTLVLSAENDDVGRIYRRAGFRRIGTTHAAERAGPA
ncbi:MAG: GNAT family N-acetyltransferase [Acidimicrobiales bacterium]